MNTVLYRRGIEDDKVSKLWLGIHRRREEEEEKGNPVYLYLHSFQSSIWRIGS